MTSGGVENLYMYLSTAWPLVIRPGAEPEWKRAKMRELYRTYEHYEDAEVLAAFQKWTNEQEKFPTTKNIMNELKWLQLKKSRKQENEELWPMDFITKEGIEWSFGLFKRADFISHHRNPEGLDPEEWERRYRIRKREIMDRIFRENKASERQMGMRETLLKQIEDKRGE